MSVVTRLWYGSLLVVVSLALSGLLARDAVAQQERDRPEAKQRERGERPTERDVLKQQVEVFEIALHALLEAEKKDAAEVLKRAIRAGEVTLEGRRDDEAHQIRERAPSRSQLAEILTLAAGLWREFDNSDKAAAVGRVAEKFASQREDRDRPREHAEERPRERTEQPTEREIVMRRIEVIKTALPALREGERRDAVDILERAVRAYEVALEGRKDEEAQRIRERMPNQEQLAGILVMASQLWREYDNEEKAAVVERLAKEIAGRRDRERDRPVRERREVEARGRPRTDEAPANPQNREEVEHLTRTVRELKEQMNAMRRQMAEMQQLLKKLADREDEDR